ncbi:hypothetical protein DI09_37p80 [Mitosporidium daphniae]|uniref:Uncharacterized protein n=1 Tax=Mitosporidium daphniae TaxID=1485682 RepID=A0A098VUP2_9MICR|nr:uncharacterized protein DI09_37p80 [Mitosporidium daphniae]KGG51371.1 hypothetical protein DI09_37p80 [Mitosporidium daphniae]|eukprot:XP_013237819.1 uncharacterized protein DI09_37p80 [Mitosporidium daphniae]
MTPSFTPSPRSSPLSSPSPQASPRVQTAHRHASFDIEEQVSPASSGIISLGDSMKSMFVDALFGAKSTLDAAFINSTAFLSAGPKIIIPKGQPRQIRDDSPLSSSLKGGYSGSASSVSRGSSLSSLSSTSTSPSREDIFMPSYPAQLLWFSPLEVLDYCTKSVVMMAPANSSTSQFSRLNYFDEVNFYRFSLMLNAEDGIGDWISQLIDT